MASGSIKAMRDYQGNDYWNAGETWPLDRGYHFWGFCNRLIGNDLRGMKAAKGHLFIISGWNSSGAGQTGGMEVVDLRAKTSGYYDSSSIPIPANGVSYCTLVVEG